MAPSPHNEHRLAPGVRGWLESPALDAVAPGCVVVSGWAFGSGRTIDELWAEWLDTRTPLEHGLTRPDVAEVYASEPNALRSGFCGYIETESQGQGRQPLEIWARFSDGGTARLFRRRLVTLAPGEQPSEVAAAIRRTLKHPSVLLSRAAWRRAVALIARGPGSAVANGVGPAAVRRALDASSRTLLENFLATRSRLTLDAPVNPIVSIVIVVWNRAELTLQCLQAVAAAGGPPAEVILVDNASTDETPLLTEQVRGLRLVRNDSNLGFTVAANIGARAAAGEFLLFLNNDAELLPGSIDHLVSTARQSPSIGAVGGKLVYPDGRLQEAGSIIWPDGSCEAYGRGADPVAPEFLFERPVDFCSGALLLTPRATFERLGRFEERFRPAYYEDADYCARLWENGYSVMYQPRAVAIHHEFGSAPSAAASMRLQRERRVLFVERHGEWLQKQRPRADGVLVARSHPHGRPAVLIIDDAVPDPRRGAGFPRAAALLNVILDLGYQVTLYTTGDERRPACGAFPTVEVVPGTPAGLRAFLHKRIGSSRSTQLLLVSRPHNMRFVKAVAGADLSALAIPCVYDAEAIFALREIGRRHIAGTGAASPFVNALPGRDDDSFVEQELKLARGCRAVLTVSERERQCFSQAGVANVFVVGHAADPDPTPTPFHLRQRVLSVGSFTAGSPNEDAALFFCREVLPLIGESLPLAQVVFAGAGIPDHLRTAWPDVTWQSDVDDLSPFYDDARVFVAPTRYAAGIPLKVVEAASRGVPVVCTPLLAEQLGWTPGADVLTAQTAAEFASAIHLLLGDALLWSRLRENALDRAKREYSREVFHSAVRRALAAAIPNANAGRVFTLEPVRISDPDTRGSGPSDVARPHDEEEAGDWSTPSRDRAAR